MVGSPWQRYVRRGLQSGTFWAKRRRRRLLLDDPVPWKYWLDAALSFFDPEACQFCGEERATVAEGFIGADCRQNVKSIEAPFCARCGLPFEGAITTSF